MLLRDILTRLHDTWPRTVGIEYMAYSGILSSMGPEAHRRPVRVLPSPTRVAPHPGHLIRAEAFWSSSRRSSCFVVFASPPRGRRATDPAARPISFADRTGIHEVATGMAHRGRLSTSWPTSRASRARTPTSSRVTTCPNSVQDQDASGTTWAPGVKILLDDGLPMKAHMAANLTGGCRDGVLEGINSCWAGSNLGDRGPADPDSIHGATRLIGGQGVVQETWPLPAGGLLATPWHDPHHRQPDRLYRRTRCKPLYYMQRTPAGRL